MRLLQEIKTITYTWVITTLYFGAIAYIIIKQRKIYLTLNDYGYAILIWLGMWMGLVAFVIFMLTLEFINERSRSFLPKWLYPLMLIPSAIVGAVFMTLVLSWFFFLIGRTDLIMEILPLSERASENLLVINALGVASAWAITILLWFDKDQP